MLGSIISRRDTYQALFWRASVPKQTLDISSTLNHSSKQRKTTTARMCSEGQGHNLRKYGFEDKQIQNKAELFKTFHTYFTAFPRSCWLRFHRSSYFYPCTWPCVRLSHLLCTQNDEVSVKPYFLSHAGGCACASHVGLCYRQRARVHFDLRLD